MQRNNKCEVCSVKILYSAALVAKGLDYTVCDSPDCRSVMAKQSSMTASSFKSFLDYKKRSIHKHRERNVARRKYIAELGEREDRENNEMYRFALNVNPALSKENTHLMYVPSGRTELSIPAEKRIDDYIERLREIISEACDEAKISGSKFEFEHDDAYNKRVAMEQKLDDNPALRIVSDKICTLCQGGCCVTGNDHAYLTVNTIRRILVETPGLLEDEILELYTSRISSESIENSCINNTASGCALPRDLRSDICNGFYCESIHAYQQETIENNSLKKIIAVKRASTYWHRLEEGIDNKIVNVVLVDEIELPE